MALSNPLRGQRTPASVGTPLPFVKVKIMDETTKQPAHGEGAYGELYINGKYYHFEQKKKKIEKQQK